jgi:hypothetical protein
MKNVVLLLVGIAVLVPHVEGVADGGPYWAADGKLPDSEVRFTGTYWDIHGKGHRVEIRRCWYCGDVISEIHFGCEGPGRTGYAPAVHRCRLKK